MNKRKIFLWLLFLTAFMALIPYDAGAQKFLDTYKKPMPDIKTAPQAEFESKTKLYQDIPMADKGLAYSIRVPSDWVKSQEGSAGGDSINHSILGDLVRFFGPSNIDTRSYFTLQARKLDYQLTAEQWLIQYMIINSYTLNGIKTYDDKRCEALYVYVDKDRTYIVRAIAQINGKRLMLAQYFLPVESWDGEKGMQAQVISSFKMTNPVEEFVEKMVRYPFVDLAEFSYPESWQAQSDPLKSVDRMNVKLLSVASEEYRHRVKYKNLNGRIEVNMISTFVVDSLDAEIKNIKDDLRRNGLMMQEKIETISDFKFDKRLQSRPVDVYNLLDNEDNVLSYEYWISLSKAGDYYYIVTLLTPARDEDYFVWSRNTQTFRTILSTIKPNMDSVLER